jgi:predicted small metal-binding protein
MGFSECNWEFLGDNDDEVLRKAREHEQRMHGAMLDDAKARALIRNA